MEQNIESTSNLKLFKYTGESLAALEAFMVKHNLSVRKMAKTCAVSHTTLHRAIQGKLVASKNFARIQFVLEHAKPFYPGDEPEPIVKMKTPTPREIAKRLAAIELALQKTNRILDRIEIEGLGVLKPAKNEQKIAESAQKRGDLQETGANLAENEECAMTGSGGLGPFST